MDFYVIPPYNLGYAMENGLFQQIKGKIVSGFWQPEEMKFYAYLPVKENKFDGFEIEQDLAINVNGNKVIDLIEKKLAAHEIEEKQMRKIRQLLQAIGVLVIKQSPQAVVNGQPIGVVEELTINADYLMHYDNPIEEKIIDITIGKEEKDVGGRPQGTES